MPLGWDTLPKSRTKRIDGRYGEENCGTQRQINKLINQLITVSE